METLYRQPRTAGLTMDAPDTLLPQSGFYDTEQFPNNGQPFRWTDGTATLQVPNPGGPTDVEIVLASGPAERVARVTIDAQGVGWRFPVNALQRHYRLLLPAADSQYQKVQIRSDILEAGRRNIGVITGDLRISGGGSAPLQLLFSFLVAVIGTYVLIRRAGTPLLGATLLVALGQTLLLVWLTLAGWRYGVFITGMMLLGTASLATVLIASFISPAHTDERPIAQWTPRDMLAIIILLIIALAATLPWIIAPDPVGDLELSARRMGLLLKDGLRGSYVGGGDYVPIRLYLLWGLASVVQKLGGNFAAPLAASTIALIKLPSLIAHLISVLVIYRWSRRWQPPLRAGLIAGIYAIIPLIWIDFAWWGQVDALLMLPLLGTVILLDRASGRWSWACWAAAALIKPQAIIIAPLLYAVTLSRYGIRGLLQGGALALAVLAAGSLPLFITGQGPGLVQAYAGSVERFPRLSNGAYNIWFLMTQGDSVSDWSDGFGPLSFRVIGMILLGVVAGLVMWTLIRRNDGVARTNAAAVLALAFFMLPTQIHERYLFFTVAFLALCIAEAPYQLPAMLALGISGSINIVGTLGGFSPGLNAAIRGSPLPSILPLINLAIFIFLIGHLLMLSRRRNIILAQEQARAPA